MAIEGMNSLLGKLQSLANIDEKLENIVGREIQKIEGEAKTLCPVDTGNLRNSINSEVEVTSNGVEGVVFTNSEYAPYVEFGTGIKGEQSSPPSAKELGITYKDTGWVYNNGERFYYTEGQPAQPFLYPALKDMEEEILTDIANEIIKILEG